MQQKIKKNNLGGILVLMVFVIFIVSVLMVLLSGADVVKKITERDSASYEKRTVVQYITTRIHQADSKGMISVRSSSGKDVLVLAEEIECDIYETQVYCEGGSLREMFCAKGLDLGLEFGEKILPLNSFEAKDMGNRIDITLTYSDGTKDELVFGIRSERGAAK